MGQFAGKVALVTGASGGLGRAVASALSEAGARIVAVGRDQRALDETAAAVGEGTVAIAADVRRAADAERAVAEAVGRCGGLDLLVNSAGVLRHGAIDTIAEDDWDLVFDTNVKGTYLMTKHAAPALRSRGGGAIVNVASVYAEAAIAGVAAYAASKAAVVALTRTAALDLIGDGIRVNCVAPASIEGPMVRAVAAARSPEDPAAALEATARLHPIGRLVQPAEVAGVVLFLLGEEAAAIVGATYAVDGGRLALLGAAAP